MIHRIDHFASLIGSIPAPAAGPKWVAVGGDSLELGATGFRIVRHRKPNENHGMVFSAWDPDGRQACCANDLPRIKAGCEEMARWMAEFDLQAGAWVRP